MKPALVGFAMLAAATFALGACGASTDCHKGDACACDGAGACEWNCVDADCAYTAGGQGLATLTCDKGGCTLDATGQGDVNFDCAGGNCAVNATGQGTIALTCAGGGCTTTCGGTGNCDTTQCPSCACNETAMTASCSVN